METVHVENGVSSQVERCYVDVLVCERKDGTAVPVSVLWPDGRTFQIDEVVKEYDLWPDLKGNWIKRFDVRIGKRTTELNLEQSIPDLSKDELAINRWYVWAKIGYDQRGEVAWLMKCSLPSHLLPRNLSMKSLCVVYDADGSF